MLTRLAVKALPGVLVIGGLIVFWEIAVSLNPGWAFYFPKPTSVLQNIVEEKDLYLSSTWITLQATLIGFLLGSLIALVAALIMAESRAAERGLMPLFVLIKVTPAVALLPIFIIILGFGQGPKVLLAALTILYMSMVAALTGFKSPEPLAREVFTSVNASRREIFFKLTVPSSLPFLLAGMKVSLPLALIGALYAEMQASTEGIGNILIQASSLVDMTTVWATIWILAAISMILVVFVTMLEQRLLRWHPTQHGDKL